MSSSATIAAAVRKAIRTARTAGRIQSWHDPHARVAERLAKALDKPDLPVSELVRLSSELDKALSRLPLAEGNQPPQGGDSDRPAAAAGGPGQGQPHPVGLASGVGPSPAVGDTALPA
jgi:hypothetical protein